MYGDSIKKLSSSNRHKNFGRSFPYFNVQRWRGFKLMVYCRHTDILFLKSVLNLIKRV